MLDLWWKRPEVISALVTVLMLVLGVAGAQFLPGEQTELGEAWSMASAGIYNIIRILANAFRRA